MAQYAQTGYRMEFAQVLKFMVKFVVLGEK